MSTQIKKNGNWVTVAGGTRMWVGTKAALQAALNAGELEDGTAVMVTDDYEEGVETLTPTKTANVSIVYESEFLKIGHLVSVNLNLIASSGILFTGLPKPAMRQTFTVNGFYEQDKALRLTVNTDGSIETDNDLAITNQNIGGHIVYVTTD